MEPHDPTLCGTVPEADATSHPPAPESLHPAVIPPAPSPPLSSPALPFQPPSLVSVTPSAALFEEAIRSASKEVCGDLDPDQALALSTKSACPELPEVISINSDPSTPTLSRSLSRRTSREPQPLTILETPTPSPETTPIKNERPSTEPVVVLGSPSEDTPTQPSPSHPHAVPEMSDGERIFPETHANVAVPNHAVTQSNGLHTSAPVLPPSRTKVEIPRSKPVVEDLADDVDASCSPPAVKYDSRDLPAPASQCVEDGKALPLPQPNSLFVHPITEHNKTMDSVVALDDSPDVIATLKASRSSSSEPGPATTSKAVRGPSGHPRALDLDDSSAEINISLAIPAQQEMRYQGTPSSGTAGATSPEPPLGAQRPQPRARPTATRMQGVKLVRQTASNSVSKGRKTQNGRSRPLRGGADLSDLRPLKETTTRPGQAPEPAAPPVRRSSRPSKPKIPFGESKPTTIGRFQKAPGIDMRDTDSSDDGKPTRSGSARRKVVKKAGGKPAAARRNQRDGPAKSRTPTKNKEKLVEGCDEIEKVESKWVNRKTPRISISDDSSDEGQVLKTKSTKGKAARKRGIGEADAGDATPPVTRKSPRLSRQTPRRLVHDAFDLGKLSESDDSSPRPVPKRKNVANREGTPKDKKSSGKKRKSTAASVKRTRATEKAGTEEDVTNIEGEDESEVLLSQESVRSTGSKINLQVEGLKQRKRRKKTKTYPEYLRKRLTPEEFSIIRIAFVYHYPSPPSNMQVLGRHQFSTGRDIDKDKMDSIYQTQLKPWGDRWWKFYHDFNDAVRAKKLAKPENVDPTVTEKEAERWALEFYQQRGPAKLDHYRAEDLVGTGSED